MGGIPHSNRDEPSRERGAQPEASTASEGSATNRDATNLKTRDAYDVESNTIRLWAPHSSQFPGRAELAEYFGCDEDTLKASADGGRSGWSARAIADVAAEVGDPAHSLGERRVRHDSFCSLLLFFLEKEKSVELVLTEFGLGWVLGRFSCSVTEMLSSAGHSGENRSPLHDGVGRAKLSLFDAAVPLLPCPMEVFDAPPKAVRTHGSEGFGFRADGTSREEYPVERLLAARHRPLFSRPDYRHFGVVPALLQTISQDNRRANGSELEPGAPGASATVSFQIDEEMTQDRLLSQHVQRRARGAFPEDFPKQRWCGG